MVRLVGPTEFVRELAPAEYAELYELVTRLGNATVILVGLAVVYWVGHRRKTASVMASALIALSVTLVAKSLFAMPRPPQAVRLIAETGYGFPSGHATAATVVYGGLAYEYGWHRRLRTAVPVAALVAVVGLSRVVLGVHYLGDVLAGFALGVVVVVGIARLTGDDPRLAFPIAAACSIVALLVTGGSDYAVLDAGASFGGLVGIAGIGYVPEERTRLETAVAVVAGLAIVVAALAIGGMVGDAAPVEAGANAVAVVGVLLVPAAVARLGLDDPGLPGPLSGGS